MAYDSSTWTPQHDKTVCRMFYFPVEWTTMNILCKFWHLTLMCRRLVWNSKPIPGLNCIDWRPHDVTNCQKFHDKCCKDDLALYCLLFYLYTIIFINVRTSNSYHLWTVLLVFTFWGVPVFLYYEGRPQSDAAFNKKWLQKLLTDVQSVPGTLDICYLLFN